MSSSDRLLEFVRAATQRLNQPSLDEAQVLDSMRGFMQALVSQDDWLPEACAQPHPQFYQQYLLYGDPLERFSVVSFVWGPGQQTPIHNHTVWGVIGMLRGAEFGQRYALTPDGLQPDGSEHRLAPGQVELVSPSVGDVHRVRNAYADQVSISIHAYGGNIGRIRRNVFDGQSGAPKDFVSGYSNLMVPNLWAAA